MTSPGFSNGRLRGVGNLPSLTNGKIWQGDGSNTPQEADMPSFELELPNKYMSFSDPTYGGTDYYVFPWAFARDSTNSVDLSVSGSTNVYSTVATNGSLQSANLTGTISVSSGSANVTFSVSQAGALQVGDVVTTAGGQSRRLASGSGTSWTAESNWTSTENTVTFKRGGKAPSTHYYVYLVSVDGSSSNYATSTRNVAGGDTLVDLGSYVYYRQLPHVLSTDSSSNLYKGMWNRTQFYYTEYATGATSYRMLSAGNSTTFASVSCATLAPKTANQALIYAEPNLGDGYVRAGGSSSSTGQRVAFEVSGWGGNFGVGYAVNVGLASQAFDYKISSAVGGRNLTLYLQGYSVQTY